MPEQKLVQSSHYGIIKSLNKLQDLSERMHHIQTRSSRSLRSCDFGFKNALIFKMVAKKLYNIDLEIRPVGVVTKLDRHDPRCPIEYHDYCVNVAVTPFGEVQFDPTHEPNNRDNGVYHFFYTTEQFKKSTFFKHEKLDDEEPPFFESQVQIATDKVKDLDCIKTSIKSNLMQLHRYIDKFIYNSSPAFNKESNYFTDYETQRLLEIHNLVCYEK